MLRHYAKMLLPLVLVVLTLVGLAAPAHAQSGTWLPNSFDKDRHVYIDPKLANDPSYPVQMDGLEQALEQRGQKHNLKIYVIASRLEDEPQDHNWANDKLNDLVLRWQSQSGFPHDDYLIILWLRRSDNPNRGHVAANGGNRLQTYGFTASKMGDPNSGPVIPALRQYMPNDPKGAMIAIADNVNAGIDDYIAAEEAAKRRAEFMKKLPGIILKVVLALAFIGLVLWLVFRYRREKRAVLALRATWQERLDSANALYIKLHDGYFGFIKDQGDWSSKFAGETLEKYRAAVTDFAEFTVRQKAANSLLDTATRFINRCYFPFVGGFRKATALLTTEKVVITGKELSLEEASLFGGVIAKVEYEPEKLLEAMSDLFDRTNKALASIVAAFRGADENKKDIDGLLAEVDATKTALTEAGLSFDPYQARYTRVKEGQAAFAAILASNPLAAYTASEAVEADARALKADLERALSIKKELSAVETEIARSVTRARTVRDEQINYQYPLSEDESQPAGVATQLFTLTEDKGNPDPVIEAARSHLKAAQAAVAAGELEKSDRERAAAIEAAKRAFALVDAVLAAKAFVEKQVPEVRTNLGKLKAAVPDADKAVAELKSDFQAGNYAGEPQKLERAKSVIGATAAELAKVKQAYDEQRYLASRANLEKTGGDIQSSRDGLVEIHSRLATLRKLRQHARDVVAVCQEQADALAGKLKANAFTTASATDEEYARLLPALGTQKKDVDKDVTDWPAAAEAADRLTTAFKGVDGAIDQQRLDHQRATEKVSAAGSAIADAQAYVNDADTRQPARNKLAAAKSELADVQAAILKPKSDWAAIGRQADEARGTAVKARDLAQADKRAADEARASISRAASNISSVDRSYGHGVTADLSSARSYLSQAKSALNSGNYEEADRLADQAYRAAESAESSAKSRVAAIVADIERKRREAEAAERRRREAAEAARRRSSSSSGGGSFGGRSGGGSHGGGRSGGGSY
jgi:uncharacterized membrane protein YgcG